MSRRIIHDEDFIDYVMTPPKQQEFMYQKPQIDSVKIVPALSSNGLGQVPMLSGGTQQDWVMPVVIIVVSAMALMTLYAVLSKR